MNVESRGTIRKRYSHSGEKYDALRTKTARGFLLRSHEVALFKRLLPEYREGVKVLEVGAGTGDFTVPVLKSGYRLTATDVNEAMLETLRAKLDENGVSERCHVQIEDVFDLSFSDDHFDLVFCVHVIPRFSNIDDQRAAVTELCRVVRPGGFLLFNYRNAGSPYNLLCRDYATKRSAMKTILKDAGMRIETTRTKHLLTRVLLDKLPLYCGKALSAIDRIFERFLPAVAWDIYVRAVKDHAAEGVQSSTAEGPAGVVSHRPRDFAPNTATQNKGSTS